MMVCCTPSVFRSNISPLLKKALACLALFVGQACAQLPDAPGREETERLCKGCHEVARSVSVRQDPEGWEATMKKMVALGLKGTEKDLQAILEYLIKNFPGEELPPLNVNKATAIELESRLSLRRSHAARIIQYRTKNGAFKSLQDIKRVPGVDAAKIEARKDRLVF